MVNDQMEIHCLAKIFATFFSHVERPQSSLELCQEIVNCPQYLKINEEKLQEFFLNKLSWTYSLLFSTRLLIFPYELNRSQ